MMKKSILSFLIFFLILQTNYSQGWVQKITGTANDLVDIHFIDVSTGFAVGQSGIILKTTNGGDNWVTMVSGTALQLNSVRFVNTFTGYAAGLSGTVIKTTNSGVNWISQVSGTSEHLFGMYLLDASTVYVAKNFSAGSSMIRTLNGGANWLSVYSGFASSTTDVFFVNSSTGFLAGSDFGLVRTNNAGTNWFDTGIPDFMLAVFFASATTGYVTGTSAGYRTTNGGINWSPMTLPIAGGYRSLYFTSESTGYIAGQLGAGSSPLLMKTTNAGVNWFDQPTGMAQYLNAIQFLNENTGYACGRVGLIIKTTTGGITGVNNFIENAVNFTLLQNYPNPFNPVTKIKFSIPENTFTKLVVYDINGKLIIRLWNGMLKKGTHEFEFNAGERSSGIYFYELSSGNFNETRKMLLIK